MTAGLHLQIYGGGRVYKKRAPRLKNRAVISQIVASLFVQTTPGLGYGCQHLSYHTLEGQLASFGRQ